MQALKNHSLYCIKFVKFPLVLIKELKKGCFSYQNWFSQFGEDNYINNFFSENKGIYLDIGSGRPISGSNTFKLYKRGWKGVCIDPLKTNRSLFRILRPRDIFILGLVGAKHTTLTFYQTFPYEYSSSDKLQIQKLLNERKVKVVQTKNYNVITIQNILQSLKSLDFLSIDTEGMDFEILQQFDLNNIRPRLICIEDQLFDRHKSETFLYLNSKGYILDSVHHPSYIYIDGS